MKRKRINLIAVIGICVLLALGYFVPLIVMAMEDHDLQSESKVFSIEEIELNFQDIDMIEELAVFPSMLSNHIIVEVGKESYEEEYEAIKDSVQQTVQEKLSSEKYQMIKTAIRDFFAVLGVEQQSKFVKFSTSNYVMMASYNDEKAYSIWKCEVVDEKELSYCFWIDDFTEKVMAFKIPYEIIGTSDENFYEAMGSLANYYGFHHYKLIEAQKYLYKSKYWEDSILLYDEKEGKKLELYLCKIGDILYFNRYPENISIYDNEAKLDK